MDAVKFVATVREYCKECKIDPEALYDWLLKYEDVEFIIKAMERWGEKHLVKTRQSKFLKMFPNAKFCTREMGKTVDICPNRIDRTYVCPHDRGRPTMFCRECMEDYWLAPIEGNSKETD